MSDRTWGDLVEGSDRDEFGDFDDVDMAVWDELEAQAYSQVSFISTSLSPECSCR